MKVANSFLCLAALVQAVGAFKKLTVSGIDSLVAGISAAWHALSQHVSSFLFYSLARFLIEMRRMLLVCS